MVDNALQMRLVARILARLMCSKADLVMGTMLQDKITLPSSNVLLVPIASYGPGGVPLVRRFQVTVTELAE